MLYYNIPYHNAILYYKILYYTALHYTTLYFTLLIVNNILHIYTVYREREQTLVAGPLHDAHLAYILGAGVGVGVEASESQGVASRWVSGKVRWSADSRWPRQHDQRAAEDKFVSHSLRSSAFAPAQRVWMYGWMDGRIGRIGRMDGSDGRMDGRVNRWMDG